MPEQPFLSKRQRGIINTYYANADAGLSQRLTELVSDLYLATGDAPKSTKMWVTVADILNKSSLDPARAKNILDSRDLESLARVAPTLKAAKKPKRAK